MGGDLNTKKSWHPHLRKNQERVWKEESKALEERKLIDKLKKEREEERQIEELQKLAEANGGKVVTKRVDWMYAGPSGDGAGVTEEREGYLLGKRRIDGLLKADTKELKKGAAVGIDAVGNGNANSARDIQKKVLEDPLLVIQKQKMEMQLKAMRDAQKEAKYEEKRAKEKERERKHKHRHHSRRDRDRSASNDHDDRDQRHRRHRREERDGHRRRSRSSSPRRREEREDRDRRDRPRRRSRSRSPYHRRSHYNDYRDREPVTHRDREPLPRREREPVPVRDRAPVPARERQPVPVREREPSPPRPDMAERLAQMQAEASALEEQRNERVRLREAEDAAAEEKHKNTRDGGRRFISGVRSKVADIGLGDAIARGRQGFRSEIDA